MPINPERLGKLQELGLTEYQARVYLTLLDLGNATASQIPALSRVPRTRIYVTMSQLHEKGLVNILPEKPIRYEPIPISDYLAKKVNEHKKDIEEMEGSIKSLSNEFSVMDRVEPEHKGRFEAIYGRRNFRDRLKEMCSRAEEEVLFVGTPKAPLRIVSALIPILEDLAKKKVKLRFIFPINTKSRDKLMELRKHAEVRHTETNPPIDWVVVDSKECLLSHPVPNDEDQFKGDDVSIWVDDLAMVNSRLTISRELWENGMDPMKSDPEVVMMNSAIRWLKLKTLKINRAPIAKFISTSIGSQIAKKFRAKERDALLREIAEYWMKSELGKIFVIKRKPITIAVENNIECQCKPDTGTPFCMFSENVLKTILDEKLGKEHVIKILKCKGIGDEKCEFEIKAK